MAKRSLFSLARPIDSSGEPIYPPSPPEPPETLDLCGFTMATTPPRDHQSVILGYRVPHIPEVWYGVGFRDSFSKCYWLGARGTDPHYDRLAEDQVILWREFNEPAMVSGAGWRSTYIQWRDLIGESDWGKDAETSGRDGRCVICGQNWWNTESSPHQCIPPLYDRAAAHRAARLNGRLLEAVRAFHVRAEGLVEFEDLRMLADQLIASCKAGSGGVGGPTP